MNTSLRIHSLMFVTGMASLFTLGCASQSELLQLRIRWARLPPALLEPVKSIEMRRRDVRTHWLKADKQTALLVLEPVMVAWLRINSDKLWTYDYLPSDHDAIDVSQRTVIVQVIPVLSFWEGLAEYRVPSQWKPVDKVQLRHNGEICDWVEVNRLLVLSPAGQIYHNHGYYGFEAECFTEGESVELIVWRGEDSDMVAVPEALRLQVNEHFLIFDHAMADGANVSPVETSQ